MRRIALTLGTLAALTGAAAAQQPARVEIGTTFGATLLNGGSETEFVVGAPAAGTLLGVLPTIYATWFATPQIMVEPQVNVLYSTMSEQLSVSGVLQLGYRLQASSRGSPYIAAHGGFFHVTDLDTETMLGGGLGYHRILSDGAAVRVELRYRRWLDSEVHDVAALVGIGIRL